MANHSSPKGLGTESHGSPGGLDDELASKRSSSSDKGRPRVSVMQMPRSPMSDVDEPWLLERYNEPHGGKDAWYQHGGWSVRRHTKHRVLDFHPLRREDGGLRTEDLTMERVTVRFHRNGEKTITKDRWLQEARKRTAHGLATPFAHVVGPRAFDECKGVPWEWIPPGKCGGEGPSSS